MSNHPRKLDYEVTVPRRRGRRRNRKPVWGRCRQCEHKVSYIPGVGLHLLHESPLCERCIARSKPRHRTAS